MEEYGKIEFNSFGHEDYELYITKITDNNPVMIFPLFDIPTVYSHVDFSVNMIVEIPDNGIYKLETNLDIPFNPIKHDIKNGELRRVFSSNIANYGAIPRTWENPYKKCKYTGKYGDNDPVDIFDIGDIKVEIGDIIQVKILGVYTLIDQGELDWKVVGININDPIANLNVNDIINIKLDKINTVYDFLINYKKSKNNKLNVIEFDGQLLDHQFAKKVILECREEWFNRFYPKSSL